MNMIWYNIVVLLWIISKGEFLFFSQQGWGASHMQYAILDALGGA